MAAAPGALAGMWMDPGWERIKKEHQYIRLLMLFDCMNDQGESERGLHKFSELQPVAFPCFQPGFAQNFVNLFGFGYISQDNFRV